MNRSNMRLLTVFAPSQAAVEEVTAILDDHDLECNVADQADGNTRTIMVTVPATALEPLESDLRATSEDVTVIVDDPMAVVDTSDSGRSQGANRDRDWLSFERISRSELRSKAVAQLPSLVIFTSLTAISAVVATAGVLLDSLAVLVGAMVIAPLLGPAMASSVATVLDDGQLFVRGVKLQLVGAGVAVACALAFAAFARSSSVVSSAVDIESSLRLGSHGLPPSLLVTVALCAGIAGGLGMATSGMTDLIGVMIAAAIMPPIGVVGVGAAWIEPTAVVGSLVVVVVNVIAINVGAIATLWTLGFHPREPTRIRTSRAAILRRVLLLLVTLGVAVRLLEYVTASL